MQAEQQLEQAKIQSEQQLEAQKLQFEQWRVQLENDTKVMIAEMQAQNNMKQHVLTLNKDVRNDSLSYLNENGDVLPNPVIANVIDTMKKGMEKLVEQQSINNQELIAKQANIIDHVTKPKTVLRDKNGKIIGVK